MHASRGCARGCTLELGLPIMRRPTLGDAGIPHTVRTMKPNGSAKTPAMLLRAMLKEEPGALDEAPTRKALPLVHPFPAPMSPYLAEVLIRGATLEDHIVLDPMAGSGVVPAEALALGRTCYAMDIDPLALMTIRVQCGRHSAKQVESSGLRALEKATAIRKNHARLDARFAREFDPETRAFIKGWFPLRVRRGLLALWQAISEVTPSQVRLPLKIAFSRVIIAKTAGTSMAIDLPHTRPHRDPDKVVPDPLEMFPRRLRELTQRMQGRHESANGAELHLRSGDVRDLPFGDRSVDLVLTSSPYANAIDYMRAHKFSLVWMGHSVDRLAGIRAQMIGAEHGLGKSAPELAWLDARLPQRAPRIRARIAVLRRFFHDMDTVVAEVRRVLRPGGACVFVLGKSYVGGQVVDTPAIIAAIAQKRGFEHIGTTYRDVNPHRRSLPFPRAGGKRNALGKRMDQEAIVALAR